MLCERLSLVITTIPTQAHNEFMCAVFFISLGLLLNFFHLVANIKRCESRSAQYEYARCRFIATQSLIKHREEMGSARYARLTNQLRRVQFLKTVVFCCSFTIFGVLLSCFVVRQPTHKLGGIYADDGCHLDWFL